MNNGHHTTRSNTMDFINDAHREADAKFMNMAPTVLAGVREYDFVLDQMRDSLRRIHRDIADPRAIPPSAVSLGTDIADHTWEHTFWVDADGTLRRERNRRYDPYR